MENKMGKFLFQLAVAAVAFAIILSSGRMLLSSSERSAMPIHNYDLSDPDMTSPFGFEILLGLVAIIAGYYLSKEYETFGKPLILAGLFSVIFVTITTYFGTILFSDEITTSGRMMLTLVIGIEWLGLLLYTLKLERDNGENSTPVSPVSPENNSN
jgi:hypothetical protein